jgi:hypothetical protein
VFWLPGDILGVQSAGLLEHCHTIQQAVLLTPSADFQDLAVPHSNKKRKPGFRIYEVVLSVVHFNETNLIDEMGH